MGHNLGSVDRVARFIIAVTLGVLFFTHTVTGVFGLILLAVGVVLLLTASVKFCPLYFALGLRTNGKKA